MMYHLKTSKHLIKNAVTSNGRRQAISAAQRISLVPAQMTSNQAMGFFVVNKNSQSNAMISYVKRGFSFPPHTKLEMPNLSPTMEKVIIIIPLSSVAGKHCEVVEERGRLNQAR